MVETENIAESVTPIDFAALRRLRVKNSRMRKLLFASLTLVFGGLVLMLASPPALAEWIAYIPEAGILLVGALVAVSFPFGRTPCPRCKKPFYVAEGRLNLLSRINLSYRDCAHCGLSLDAEETGETSRQSGRSGVRR